MQKVLTNWQDKIPFLKSKEMIRIANFIRNERDKGKVILPNAEDVFNALKYTSFECVKVVILGQDPYPNRNHAHGIAFSIPENCADIPASLQNILKELRDDLGVEKKNGNLYGWAKQGVLLLNTSLTVEEGKPASHKGIGWELLIRQIIDVINEEKDRIAFVLWGSFAQNFCKNIDVKKHYILKSVHPSPLSAYRGFFGSRPFSKVNEYLIKNGITPIDWSK